MPSRVSLRHTENLINTSKIMNDKAEGVLKLYTTHNKTTTPNIFMYAEKVFLCLWPNLFVISQNAVNYT